MKVTSDRTINMTEGSNYEQQGNYGVGHQEGGEIRDNAKVAGHLEEKNHNQSNKTDINLTVNIDSQYKSQAEETSQNNHRVSDTCKFEITLSGELTKDQRASYKGIEIEIEDIVEKLSELGIKHKLTIKYVKQGSIKIGLEGHPEDFQKLQELIQSGQLSEILEIPIEDISLIAENLDKEIVIDGKDGLIEAIRNQGAEGKNLSGANLSGANLSGTDMRRVDLSGANLRAANLSGANLRAADLSEVNLTGTDMRRVDLRGAYLKGAYLNEANLSRANLGGANISGANISGAKVEEAIFGDNEGITESLKQDLISRGAFFKDIQEVYV